MMSSSTMIEVPFFHFLLSKEEERNLSALDLLYSPTTYQTLEIRDGPLFLVDFFNRENNSTSCNVDTTQLSHSKNKTTNAGAGETGEEEEGKNPEPMPLRSWHRLQSTLQLISGGTRTDEREVRNSKRDGKHQWNDLWKK